MGATYMLLNITKRKALTHAAAMTNLIKNELVSTLVLCMASALSWDNRLSSMSAMSMPQASTLQHIGNDR